MSTVIFPIDQQSVHLAKERKRELHRVPRPVGLARLTRALARVRLSSWILMEDLPSFLLETLAGGRPG